VAILLTSQTAQEEKGRWGTQWECFYDAAALTGYSFILDTCAEAPTAKCANFITPGEDALTVDWVRRAQEIVTRLNNIPFTSPALKPVAGWCNMPFTQKPAFLSKCFESARGGFPIVALCPYERSTGWWREYVKGKATRVFIPNGRYNFLKVDGKTKKTGVNFLSCFVEFGIGAGFGETQFIDFKRGVHKS